MSNSANSTLLPKNNERDAIGLGPLDAVVPDENGYTIADKYLDRFCELCPASGVPLDFILPLVCYKEERFIQDVICHLERFIDRIPLDSKLGQRLAGAA